MKVLHHHTITRTKERIHPCPLHLGLHVISLVALTRWTICAKSKTELEVEEIHQKGMDRVQL